MNVEMAAALRERQVIDRILIPMGIGELGEDMRKFSDIIFATPPAKYDLLLKMERDFVSNGQYLRSDEMRWKREIVTAQLDYLVRVQPGLHVIENV